jgi:hypothetical protein
MKSLCRALLVLDILYCALAIAEPRLPGWHMFESVDRLDFVLRDRNGVAVDVRAYLPRDAYLVDKGELYAIVRFICEREHDRAPFVLVDNTSGTSLTTEANCRVR